MSLEGFVRAAGGVMGAARDGFGTGVGALLPVPAAPVSPPAQVPGADGQAALGAEGSAWKVANEVAALDSLDSAGNAELDAALASSQGGRTSMESIIAQAIADVQALGLVTNTPEGKRALIAAIKTRLEETRGTVDSGSAEAGTHAASTQANAAAYRDVGAAMRPPMAASSPLGSMLSGMGGMPGAAMGGGGMPGFGPAPMGALSGMSGLMSPLSKLASTGSEGSTTKLAATTNPRSVSPAAKIPLSAVRFDRERFAGGKEMYRRYINEALDTMGIEDPAARRRWGAGLMTAAARESSFNPLAINLGDSNAHGAKAADGFFGNSSRGGLQTIPTTFAAYHQPGTSTNIYEPIANICAAMNYVMGRYGVDRSAVNLAKVPQFDPQSAGGGY